MFQSFQSTASPEQGPPRLKALRKELETEGLAGFLVPRADAHQGEYVAPHDDRLAWLTGFTGSAGFCAALRDVAGVFVDGRYRLQVRDQVADDFTPVNWPEVQLGDWLKEQLSEGDIGFDPWLHTVEQVEALETSLTGSALTLQPMPNLVDRVWEDQPLPPMAPAMAYPLEFAGEPHADKIARLAEELRAKDQSAAVITLPDSLCWLLNIRGADIERNPVAHGFAILHAEGRVDLFMAAEKLVTMGDHLGDSVAVHDPATLLEALVALDGPVRLEKSSVPLAIASALEVAEIDIAWDSDPCALPKACKNASEIAGTREAHLRDGAAVSNFLTWFDAHAESGITEIDVATKLEEFRRETNALRDISFDTIAGTGPNGAIIHYRVTHETNQPLKSGQIMVVDSGGQYIDGTTDITRTLPIGAVGDAEKRAFTRVLQGMIAISRLRWPKGMAGRDLEAIGRMPLWLAGQNFNHGLGHGVGTYLCVHEGPQRLSRVSTLPLEPGMILSNEPGHYKDGAYGIRIENLLVVEEAPTLPEGDDIEMLQFSTLTYVPIDQRLIVADMLSQDEKAWLNAYHQMCRDVVGPRLDSAAREWLDRATAPLT